uniref:Uncharacterized protein n=1 Tax=Globodera rostochiensis TaxID=31243 RepID=A0A914HXG4_GLORO
MSEKPSVARFGRNKREYTRRASDCGRTMEVNEGRRFVEACKEGEAVHCGKAKIVNRCCFYTTAGFRDQIKATLC